MSKVIEMEFSKEWKNKNIQCILSVDFYKPTKSKLVKKGIFKLEIKGWLEKLGTGEDIDIYMYCKNKEGKVTHFNRYTFKANGNLVKDNSLIGLTVDDKMFLYPNVVDGHIYDKLISEHIVNVIEEYLW